MRFNDRAKLDTSQVRDRRASRGGGGGLRIPNLGGGSGGGMSRGGGMAVGGGALGVIVVLAILAFTVFGGGGGSTDQGGGLPAGLGQLGAGQAASDTDLADRCRTGADASTNEDCAAVAVINSVQAYWQDALAASGGTYQQAPTVFYSGSTSTACGQGSAGMGPFYCPADATVYIDLSFWQDLRTQFGADSGPFSQAYVLAHEYGHHVQHLLGTADRVGTESGPESGSVRLELQADCYAGVWADHASTTPGSDGQVLITDITDADIAAAVDTAGRIGDDAIMARSGGAVDESRFTHGSSDQRERWLTIGLQTGDPATCNTFDTADLG
ncbi:KPN_02809 family neutral zinc metallopeptidase [Nakamurella leprariae]|uniref:Neutral zinc metallopeptidase n=1 Tax=Nakamurella leprariae TaxID=2803911 RepID=A0A938YGX4_9ACTN|nr:neutral zinc metallopeptidase [Nakamurella leprariae]MBM9467894.1 neutral zinc metallopeptidase [Nakamurella leprariae]